jgi:uncharacterized Tic20 family protein
MAEFTPPPSVPSNYSTPPVVTPLTPSEERTWAMLAHLSCLLNLATGFFGAIAALIIYIIFKDRSRYVAYQAFQSMIMQLICWIGGGILIAAAWTLSSILMAVVVGIFCMPFACVLSLIPFANVGYSIIGAVKCNQGEDFKYWLVGDWVRSVYTG